MVSSSLVSGRDPGMYRDYVKGPLDLTRAWSSGGRKGKCGMDEPLEHPPTLEQRIEALEVYVADLRTSLHSTLHGLAVVTGITGQCDVCGNELSDPPGIVLT